MKRQEQFFAQIKQKQRLYSTIQSPLRQRSAILENIRWTQMAYAVLCQPQHKDTLFSFKSKHRNHIQACSWVQTHSFMQPIHYYTKWLFWVSWSCCGLHITGWISDWGSHITEYLPLKNSWQLFHLQNACARNDKGSPPPEISRVMWFSLIGCRSSPMSFPVKTHHRQVQIFSLGNISQASVPVSDGVFDNSHHVSSVMCLRSPENCRRVTIRPKVM